MNKWKLQVTCPQGHNDKIVLYYDEYELMFTCVKCNPDLNTPTMFWWEPSEKELKANGVTLS